MVIGASQGTLVTSGLRRRGRLSNHGRLVHALFEDGVKALSEERRSGSTRVGLFGNATFLDESP